MVVSGNVTLLLTRWSEGDESAIQDLIPLVYRELRRLAGSYLREERPGHTLQATALVHEAYLQIQQLQSVDWKGRAHFIAMAANCMRRILIDNARRHRADKRGGWGERADFDENRLAGPPEALCDVLAVDQLLTRLEEQYPRQAKVVELRFFGGLTTEEAATVLQEEYPGVSSRTLERDWRFARARLHLALTSTPQS